MDEDGEDEQEEEEEEDENEDEDEEEDEDETGPVHPAAASTLVPAPASACLEVQWASPHTLHLI